MSRLTLSDADKQARDWFVETTKSLGCIVKIDAMGILPHPWFLEFSADELPGNIFAIRPGKKDGPPTYAGSHMDTQVILQFQIRSHYDQQLTTAANGRTIRRHPRSPRRSRSPEDHERQ